MARVVVGLSGGVDSSVAALLLKEQGHEVIGVYMRNWNDESVTINNECPWIEDSNDALLVAEHLEIPFQVMDFSAEYKSRIVDYMFAEYKRGRTPNPDVLCNREIKFDAFLEMAMQLKADFVATGHYCRKKTLPDGSHQLLAGLDANKDQSYFLCQVTQEQLSKALFPIGEMQKDEVRLRAEKAGLPTAKKKDSQGLCFVGKVKLPVFLQQQLQTKTGAVYELPSAFPYFPNGHHIDEPSCYHQPNWPLEQATKIGEHQGAHFFTVGQRKGLGIGGRAIPLFVVGLDTLQNIVFVAEGENHPALLRHGLVFEPGSENWPGGVVELAEGEQMAVLARIRYRQALKKATLMRKNGQLALWFENSQKAVTPGQFAACYNDDGVLLCSGVIMP
ncbi:MAG: tRNA 2-thiouridine(34) synthase MnmA [Cryomorphaceae bacterium]|nr:tRNA 2-thiouridine(34) synthase MnmA [Cryomorphaceae bacterium]